MDRHPFEDVADRWAVRAAMFRRLRRHSRTVGTHLRLMLREAECYASEAGALWYGGDDAGIETTMRGYDARDLAQRVAGLAAHLSRAAGTPLPPCDFDAAWHRGSNEAAAAMTAAEQAWTA